jgi:hypothetical protein
MSFGAAERRCSREGGGTLARLQEAMTRGPCFCAMRAVEHNDSGLAR